MTFTLSGGHIEAMLDGLAEDGIEIIDVGYEEAVAVMAHAWSIFRREPGGCLMIAGPGFTNAMIGIANANLDGVSVVLFCGKYPIWLASRIQAHFDRDACYVSIGMIRATMAAPDFNLITVVV